MSFGRYVISTDECPVREYVDQDQLTGVATPKLVGKKDILYVDGGGCETPSFGVSTIADIKRNDGTSAFKIFSLK